MAQQPNYAQMNERIAVIEDLMEKATSLYGDIIRSDNTVSFEAYTELRELYYEITEAITDYFEYLSTYDIPQKDSYLFEWLYGKYYQIEIIDDIDSLLKELDEQAAEEVAAN
jgi:hypothetical protein